MENTERISVRKSELVPRPLTDKEKQEQSTAYETGKAVALGYLIKYKGRDYNLWAVAFCNGTSVFIKVCSRKIYVDVDENK